LIIGLAVSLVALWLAFRNLDWQSFGQALGQGKPLGLIAGAALLLASVPLRGLRWRIFLAPVKEVPLKVTNSGTLLGLFANIVLPLRLGELVRSYYVARQTASPMSQVLGSILVERAVDYMSFLLLLVILPILGVLPNQFRVPLMWALVLGSIVALVTLWLALRSQGPPRLRGRLNVILANLQLAFTSLRHVRHTPTIVLTSVGIWLFYLLSAYLTLRAMHLQLSLADAYLLLVVTTLVLSVPITPGSIGTYHFAAIMVLVNIMSVEQSQAQAAAVALHAVGVIPYTVIGAVVYFRSHLRLREVRDSQRDSYSEASS
ncbi:MAG: flippase-like domain-containing protein, partial [Candidatus Marinimicrobia bacterium]|nr:flippase-like domain-containing protein [Candidatus Neomarinimicrobiota bacterium]